MVQFPFFVNLLSIPLNSFMIEATNSFDSTLLLEIFTIFIVGISLITGFLVLLLPRLTSNKAEREQSKTPFSLPSSPLPYQPAYAGSPSASKPMEILSTDSRTRSDSMKRNALIAVTSEAFRILQYADTYRSKLDKNPSMKQLRILNMPWSDLLQVYVQLYLRRRTRTMKLEPTFGAEATSDPYEVLWTERLRLERQNDAAIEPSEAIRIHQRCIILGNPGVGKTTLLKYLALRCARRELRDLSDLPIYIDLNAFMQSEQATHGIQVRDGQVHPFLAFMASQWLAYDFPLQEAITYMENNLKEGSALLLLDGLGETLSGQSKEDAERTYEQISLLINRLSDSYPKSFIVVAVRTSWYQQHPALIDFTELEVLQFREHDIKHFVHNWFAHHAPVSGQQTSADSADRLLDALLQPQLQEITSNPLLLSMLVLTQLTNLQFPTQRIALYECCVEMLYAVWEKNQRVHTSQFHLPSLAKEGTKRLLQEIAWYLHSRGHYYFSSREIHALVAEFVSTPSITMHQIEQILTDLCTDSGMLREQTTGVYSFLHFTFQEYFAACAIKEREERVELLLKNAHMVWWKEILLFYTGVLTDATEIVKHLWLAANDQQNAVNALFHKNLLLVGECLGVSQSVSLTYRSDVIHALFSELTQTTFSLTRQQIAETLARMGEKTVDGVYLRSGRPASETINRRLLDMLLKEDTISLEVKECIAYALGIYGSGEVIMELTEGLANEWLEVEVRLRAIQALHLAHKWYVADKIIAMLPNRLIHGDVRVGMVKALGNMLSEKQYTQLINLLLDTTCDLEVRYAIADLIGAEGNNLYIPDLQAAYNSTNMKSNFILACRLIIALAALGHDEFVPVLFSTFANNLYTVDMRLEIISGLAALRSYKLVPSLFKLLENDRIDWRVRIGILVALEAIGGQAFSAPLFQLLNKREIDMSVRIAIANVLGTLNDSHLISSLHQTEKQREDASLQRSILIARGRLGDKSTASTLLDWLLHQQQNSITALECLSLLDALRSILTKSSPKDTLSLTMQEYFIQLVQSGTLHMDVQRYLLILLPQCVYKTCHSQEVRSLLKNIIMQKLTSVDDAVNETHYALWEIECYMSDVAISSVS